MVKILSLKEKVDPQHTALIVVDVQNDAAHSEGAFGKMGFDMSMIQGMVARLVRFIDEARKVKLPIIYIKGETNPWAVSDSVAEFLYGPGGENEPFFAEGTWGAEFYEGISPREDEKVVVKHYYSAFFGSDLDMILRSLGTKTVIMTGIASNVCVGATVRDAFQLGYRVVLPEDLTTSYLKEKHEAELANVRMHFGTVVSAKEILAAWS
jgi:ureidoacrylate peracid hydrolase